MSPGPKQHLNQPAVPARTSVSACSTRCEGVFLRSRSLLRMATRTLSLTCSTRTCITRTRRMPRNFNIRRESLTPVAHVVSPHIQSWDQIVCRSLKAQVRIIVNSYTRPSCAGAGKRKEAAAMAKRQFAQAKRRSARARHPKVRYFAFE